MNASGHRFPKEIILFAVYSKLKFGLSYREVEELLQMRGVSIDHSTALGIQIHTIHHP
jgi:putative transposase